MVNCEAELVLDAKANIGESPVWSGDDGALYWIDVKAPALYRTDISTLRTKAWSLPSDIGGYGLKRDGRGAVLGLRTGVFALDFASGDLSKLCDAPFDPLTHRFNEGDCDAEGRLWLGTMFDPPTGISCEPIKQDLYCLTGGGDLVPQNNFALLHNGFAWNAEGSEFFIAHSYEGRIYACTFDLSLGKIGHKRIFAEIPKDLGIPDGGAFDADGFYWSAIHGGGCLHRYAPNGRLDEVVEFPVRHPTMMAFCGAGLRELFVTSASHGKPGEAHAGGLFRLKPSVPGLARRARLR